MRVTLTADEAELVRQVVAKASAEGWLRLPLYERLDNLFTPVPRLMAELRPEVSDDPAAHDAIPTCPRCGGQTFGYLEGCEDYRTPSGSTPDAAGGGIVAVYWSSDGTAESGDSDPGLFCDGYQGGGCGAPIDLPPGWEIDYQ